MANFAPLVGEALPAYGLPRPAFPYEEGDANKSTPGMKWLPINYAKPAKCNDFLTLRGAGECYPRLRPILEGCRRVLELANGETVGVGSAAAPKGAEALSIRMRWPAFNSQRERKLEIVDDKGMAVSACDADSVEKLFASTERDTIAVVDAIVDVGCSDEMLRAMHENRQAIDAYFEKVRRLLAPSGKLVVVSCNRIEGVGGPSLACVAEARGWNVVTSFAQNDVIDVVVYEPRPGPTPPAPLPPDPKPDQGMFAQRNLRLRIAPEEYCPDWPEDEEEDNPLPGWVEGDSLAPYVGSDPSMLAEALTYAWLTPLDVVCDVGCGDGRFVTTAVQKLGAERGYGLDIDAELVARAQDLARRRGVGHRTTFLTCDCSEPSPDVWKILDECTLLVMYLLPEALQKVRPIIDKHLSGPMLGRGSQRLT